MLTQRNHTSLRSTLLLLSLAILSTASWGQGVETVVTTYVVKKQEERDSTRFTLTEWLRIRERMKMMDVWLAMFSDPQKDSFSPELNVWMDVQRTNVKTTRDGTTDEGSLSSKQAGGQLYLTNLFTYATRLRTLNIDLGGEGIIRESSALDLDSTTSSPVKRRETLKYFLGDLRIFGKHVQDSSLVLKYGQYFLGSSLASRDITDLDRNLSGQAAGAELQLYLFRWLGVQGQAIKFGNSSSAFASDTNTGLSYQYGPYIEVAIFRLEGGIYKENWNFTKTGESDTTTDDTGYFAGLKVML